MASYKVTVKYDDAQDSILVEAGSPYRAAFLAGASLGGGATFFALKSTPYTIFAMDVSEIQEAVQEALSEGLKSVTVDAR